MSSCIGERAKWSDRRGSGCWSPCTEKGTWKSVLKKVMWSENGRRSKVRSKCFHEPKFLNFPALLPGREITQNQRRNTREANCKARLDQGATREGTAKESLNGRNWGRLAVAEDWHCCLSLGVLRGFQANYLLTVVMSHGCACFWEEWCHPSDWRCQSMLRDVNYSYY